jgi:23S rRNA-intervening sequence protein
VKKAEELTVITKMYDLILWSCNHTSKFPRNHRFVLGERIERNLYNLLETLIAAKYTKNRQRLLEDANLSLEVLRFQMRLAKDLQCLKVESYAFAARSIDEIGRLILTTSRTSPLTQNRFCAWIMVDEIGGFKTQ